MEKRKTFVFVRADKIRIYFIDLAEIKIDSIKFSYTSY